MKKNTEFVYDKEWADDLYQTLLTNQDIIKDYAKMVMSKL